MTDEQLLQVKASDLLDFHDWERMHAGISAARQNERASFECHIPQGSRSVLMWASSSLVRKGNTSYVVTTLFDPSKHFAGDATLAETAHIYGEVFPASSDAIFVHGANGEILDVNDRMCKMFDCSRDEVIGGKADRFSLGESP